MTASRWSRLAGPAVLILAAASFGSVAVGAFVPSDVERELAGYAPTAEQPDPALRIPGVVLEPEGTGPLPGEPPTSGARTALPAACAGVTHPAPLPDAAAVRALAHGAVWITYDPVRTAERTVAALATRVADGTSLMMSPAPGLPTPLSVQSWRHRLRLDTPEDPRFEQFIVAAADNRFVVPEPDGTCSDGG